MIHSISLRQYRACVEENLHKQAMSFWRWNHHPFYYCITYTSYGGWLVAKRNSLLDCLTLMCFSFCILIWTSLNLVWHCDAFDSQTIHHLILNVHIYMHTQTCMRTSLRHSWKLYVIHTLEFYGGQILSLPPLFCTTCMSECSESVECEIRCESPCTWASNVEKWSIKWCTVESQMYHSVKRGLV